MRTHTQCVILISALLLAGCASGSGGSAGGVPSAASHPSSAPTASSACDPIMGTCLGDLTAGTYSSTSFTPKLTYTVPDGWTNFMDRPADFWLARTDDADINGYGPNGIGILRDFVAMAQDCSQQPASGVGHTAAELAGWLSGLPGLKTSPVRPISLAGLNGVTLDIRMAKGWQKMCDWSPDKPTVPLFIGGAASQARRTSQALFEGASGRLYLLDRAGGSTILIAIVDIPTGPSLADYVAVAEPIVKKLKFAK
jgi:hypothetical protein